MNKGIVSLTVLQAQEALLQAKPHSYAIRGSSGLLHNPSALFYLGTNPALPTRLRVGSAERGRTGRPDGGAHKEWRLACGWIGTPTTAEKKSRNEYPGMYYTVFYSELRSLRNFMINTSRFSTLALLSNNFDLVSHASWP